MLANPAIRITASPNARYGSGSHRCRFGSSGVAQRVITSAPTARRRHGTRPASCNQPGERLSGPHAVSRVGTTDYCYDAAGNQVRSSDGRRIDYTPFDLPSSIRRTDGGLSAKSEFDYGPGRERIGRRDYASATDLVPQLWVHVLGSTDVEYAGSGQLHQVKRTVGGVIIKVARQSGVLVTRREWLFQDA